MHASGQLGGRLSVCVCVYGPDGMEWQPAQLQLRAMRLIALLSAASPSNSALTQHDATSTRGSEGQPAGICVYQVREEPGRRHRNSTTACDAAEWPRRAAD